MEIRRAAYFDANDIYNLIDRSRIDRNSKSSSGIIEYDITPEDIKSRISENELAFVNELSSTF